MSGFLIAVGLTAFAIVLYSVRLNRVLSMTPKEAADHAGKPPTKEEIREVLDRVRMKRIDWVGKLPPRKERRYIIVGGSGLVGGQMVLDLLANGTPPEAIRILDARRPVRDEFLREPASKVSYVQTDITNEAVTRQSYAVAWPSSVEKLPLTVFHTAAVIRPFETLEMFYERTSRVNVTGVMHSMNEARASGAELFIATSSSNAGLGEVGWMLPPWAKYPKGFVQVFGDKDFFEPPRPVREHPTLYARSKAVMERLVCDADAKKSGGGGGGGGDKAGMRTGVIRPGNAVYGRKDDNMIDKMMVAGRIPTWVAGNVQNFMHYRNASLGHLQYEDALLGEYADKVAARPFLITDAGPPIRFQTMYDIMAECGTGFQVDYPPPVLMLVLCFLIEWYAAAVNSIPFLNKILSEPGEPIRWVQPGVFATGLNSILDDSDAKRKPQDGGIGYTPCCTIVEGMCQQVVEWDEWVERQKKK